MIAQALQKFKGIGEAKAISIAAAMELGRYRRGAEAVDRKSITSSQQAFEIFHPLLVKSHIFHFTNVLSKYF